jgi:hypothetical protein
LNKINILKKRINLFALILKIGRKLQKFSLKRLVYIYFNNNIEFSIDDVEHVYTKDELLHERIFFYFEDSILHTSVFGKNDHLIDYHIMDLKNFNDLDTIFRNMENTLIKFKFVIHSKNFFNKDKSIPEKEKNYVDKRLQVAKDALAKLLKVDVSKIKRVPVIGLSCSGGGLRSMTACVGYYQYLIDSGLMDCITYNSVLRFFYFK